MTTRAQIVSCARTWVGTPYRHQASVKGRGADCSGLLRGVGAELGLALTSRTDYAKQLDVPLEVFLLEISANLERIEIADARNGDVLLFWFEAPDRPYHFAFVSDVGIIHAYQSVRKVVETVLSDDWRARIHSAWRVPGVEDG